MNKKRNGLRCRWLLGGVCVAMLLFCACGKRTITETLNQNQIPGQETEKQTLGKLLMESKEELEGQLCIPLETESLAEQIVLENHYRDRELWIYIPAESPTFYNTNAIVGDVAEITDSFYVAYENQVILKFVMSSIKEYQSTLENGNLKVTMHSPKEVYEQIVVIDPAGGGSEWGITVDGYTEKELTCKVAALLEKKISEPNIKLYITRTEDVEISTEERLQLVQEVDADMYLRLGVSQAEDTAIYGILAYYNEEYVIPEFGNVQWADLVTKKVTTFASNKALGLLPAEEGSLLQILKIPAAQIHLGFMSNPQEYLLMQQESYQEKLAQGIAEAILEVYTNKNILS